MWTTFWGLFGIAYTLALAVIALSPEYMWLQPWFLRGAAFSFAASILCLSWPLWRPLLFKARKPCLICEWSVAAFPMIVPKSGYVATIEPFLIEGQGGRAMITMQRCSGEPGSSLTWANHFPIIYRCSLRNCGTDPLFDLHMTVKALFFESITVRPGTTQRGNYLDSALMKLTIPSLDVGMDNSFVFYVTTQDRFHFSEVHLPQSTSYITAEGGNRKSAKFLAALADILPLPPAIIASNGMSL
jgi:hypothetical protein